MTDERPPNAYAYDALRVWARKTPGADFDLAMARLADLLKPVDRALGLSDWNRLIDQVKEEMQPSPTEARVDVPADLFIVNPRTGDRRPDPAAFVGWFRRSERFVVPIERGTFSTGGNFELLHYGDGYYNGMARPFVRGRVEDAFRSVGLSSTDSFREEMVRAIAATSELHRKRTDFNPAGLLCLENGILDTATGQVRAHSPDVVFTWRMPVAYDPSATCPRFEQFLREVMPDDKKRELLVDLMGYCLWRDNPHHLFFVLVGDGANGKTTFGRVLSALLGKDAVSTLSLQQIGSNRFAGAELEGRLVNLCDDLPYDRPLAATGVLKVLTGGGSLTVERKHQHPFDLTFGGKLVSMANRLPPTEDDTYAFWRRAVVISFEQVFPHDDPRRDPVLFDKLAAELPGILNVALRGLARVLSRADFDPDGLFMDSEEEWRRRADPIRAELLEAFEYCPGAFVTNDRIREWHVALCQSQNREPLGSDALGKAVGRVFPLSRPERKQVAGKRVWGRPGLRERVTVAGVGGGRGLDAMLYPTPGVPGGPEMASTPATPFSRQEPGQEWPGLPGGVSLDMGAPNPVSREKVETPANPGHLAPSGGVIGPLIPAPVGDSSRASDETPRTPHRNCPLCSEIEHHICTSCPACRWEMAHAEDQA